MLAQRGSHTLAHRLWTMRQSSEWHEQFRNTDLWRHDFKHSITAQHNELFVLA